MAESAECAKTAACAESILKTLESLPTEMRQQIIEKQQLELWEMEMKSLTLTALCRHQGTIMTAIKNAENKKQKAEEQERDAKVKLSEASSTIRICKAKAKWLRKNIRRRRKQQVDEDCGLSSEDEADAP